MELLGAQLDIQTEFADAPLPHRRALELIHDLNAILKRGRLTPAGASKMRGRLVFLRYKNIYLLLRRKIIGFAQSLAFGKLGRALPPPFTERQYTRTQSTRYPLNDDLREAITWWLTHLGNQRPRRVNFKLRHPVLVYSDACGAGHIGCIVYYGGEIFRVSTHLPTRFASANEKITEYELAGTLLGLCTAVALFPNAPILLGCDNQGANGTVIRGPNKTRNGRSLASVFWHIAAEWDCMVWVEFVRSKLNPSDPISRMRNLLGENAIPRAESLLGVPVLFRTIF